VGTSGYQEQIENLKAAPHVKTGCGMRTGPITKKGSIKND